MTKEQLMAKVHKDMQNILEFVAVGHDKLGNGYQAFAYVIKKQSNQVGERIRKELEKRAFQTHSRKLFSIYRYKIVNLHSAYRDLE